MAKYTQNESNRFNNLEMWQLHDFEICFFLHYPRAESEQSRYKLNIPALMPDIPPARPVEGIANINRSIFINDKGCKLPVSPTINTQNYVSIPKRSNEHFNHRYIDFMSTIYVETVTSDIDSMYVTTRKDPSYCDSCITQHPYYYHS